MESEDPAESVCSPDETESDHVVGVFCVCVSRIRRDDQTWCRLHTVIARALLNSCTHPC